MIVAQYFDYFISFSFIGWAYECIYCTVKEKHWQNRGFLFGPICPIYGCGVVGALIIFHLLPPMTGGKAYPVWEIFLVCAVGSAIMEFVTSWVLEKWLQQRSAETSGKNLSSGDLRFLPCRNRCGKIRAAVSGNASDRGTSD